MVVDVCLANSVLDFYRRQCGTHPLCGAVSKGEHAATGSGIFGKGRAGEDAAGSQNFDLVSVWGASSGISTNSRRGFLQALEVW